MKKIMLTLTVLAMVTLVGCSSISTNKTKEKVSTTEQSFKIKTIQNIDMKLSNIKATQSGKDEKKNIVVFSMAFENNDQMAVGIGGGDFKFKSGDKTYEFYAEGNNIGQEIEVGKMAKGDIYFELPSSVKKGTLVYAPTKEELGQWNVSIPGAK